MKMSDVSKLLPASVHQWELLQIQPWVNWRTLLDFCWTDKSMLPSKASHSFTAVNSGKPGLFCLSIYTNSLQMCMNSLKRVSQHCFLRPQKIPREEFQAWVSPGPCLFCPNFSSLSPTWQKLERSYTKSQSSAFSRSQNTMEETSEKVPFEVRDAFILSLNFTLCV